MPIQRVFSFYYVLLVFGYASLAAAYFIVLEATLRRPMLPKH